MVDGEKLAALEKALLNESMDPVDLPFSLLMSITENFSNAREIGRGGFGAVYKGVLPSGGTVAVKQLFERYEILDKNFESEVTCLAGVKHKNTVRFLGYCSETQQVLMPYDDKRVLADVRQRLLCFEYLPKGCLADYLSDASCQLQWTTRYQIIKGICEGIHYLHQQRFIHMDLKPQNILLDDNMEKNSLKYIMGLSELTNLRELSVKKEFSLGTPKVDALAFSIGKLHNLECLHIFGCHLESENLQLGSLSNPFQHMERLCMKTWWFCRVPKWMDGLHCLRVLELQVDETSTEEIHLLGELPSLVYIDFGAGKIPDERAILGTGLFSLLEYFNCASQKDITAYLGFEAGAMPKLRILGLSVVHWSGTIPVGMEHLLHLQEIRVHLACHDDVVCAFKEASLVHPNRPSVRR